MKPLDIFAKVNLLKKQGYSIDYITMSRALWDNYVEEYPKACLNGFDDSAVFGEIQIKDAVIEVRTRVLPYVGNAFELDDDSKAIYAVFNGSEILISNPTEELL